MSDQDLQKAIEFTASQLNDSQINAYVKATLQPHLTSLICEQDRRAKARA